MIRKDTEKSQIMTAAQLRQLLTELVKSKEIDDDFEIWLSSDEEGNEFLPMLKNTEFSLAIEKDTKRIKFFPSHR
jgi:hypothetical protein